jgi:hypothetical protein
MQASMMVVEERCFLFSFLLVILMKFFFCRRQKNVATHYDFVLDVFCSRVVVSSLFVISIYPLPCVCKLVFVSHLGPLWQGFGCG